MKETKCIYKITNDFNNLIYIGVAEDFESRLYQHKVAHDAEKSYIDKAIKKHGWHHFKMEVIDHYLTEEERKTKEQYYIKLFRSHRSENGYNLTWGGEDCCFPNVQGENNPRAQFTAEDVKNIRIRRMNGERLAVVFEDYKDKVSGDKRAGFSKIWLHESWLDICPEFKEHYPIIGNEQYATIRKNNLLEKDYLFLEKYFKWFGPSVKYNIIYKDFKEQIDWESFQQICKQIIEKIYGKPSTRTYRKKIGFIDKQIENFRKELKEEPKREN